MTPAVLVRMCSPTCALLPFWLARSGIGVVSAKQNRNLIGTRDEPHDLSLLHFWLEA